MNQFMRDNKSAIRKFLVNYSDERLCALLAHAQEGRLVFKSCCCFVGAATADHALVGKGYWRLSWLRESSVPQRYRHYLKARYLEGSQEAEAAFYRLAWNSDDETRERCLAKYDVTRRTRLIPIIKAELKRREAVRKEADNENRLQRMETRYPQLHADELQRRETSDALGACPEQLALL